jgi:hypothetical protein
LGFNPRTAQENIALVQPRNIVTVDDVKCGRGHHLFIILLVLGVAEDGHLGDVRLGDLDEWCNAEQSSALHTVQY